MARINCDDDYWTDPRREALGLLIGDQEKADGRMLRAWRISQSYWKQGEQLVPDSIWEAARLNGVIEVGLAERREGGVYCKGSSDHFTWVNQRAEAARIGGKASAVARKERTGTALPTNARNRPKTEAPTEANVRYAAERPERPSEALPKPQIVSDSLSSDSLRETTSLVGSSPTPLDLARIWNEGKAPSQPEVRLASLKSSTARWRSAAARLKEFPDLDQWRDVVSRLAKSPWHAGENDRGWKAGFDFLVKPDTYVKAIEGSYGSGGSEKSYLEQWREQQRAEGKL